MRSSLSHRSRYDDGDYSVLSGNHARGVGFGGSEARAIWEARRDCSSGMSALIGVRRIQKG